MSKKLLARVYYQKDFTKYGIGGEALHIFPEKSVFIVQFCFDTEFDPDAISDKKEFCDHVFYKMNHLDVPVGHVDRPKFEEAEHTSMSVGDYIIFEDGDIWICDSFGWKVLTSEKEKV